MFLLIYKLKLSVSFYHFPHFYKMTNINETDFNYLLAAKLHVAESQAAGYQHVMESAERTWLNARNIHLMVSAWPSQEFPISGQPKQFKNMFLKLLEVIIFSSSRTLDVVESERNWHKTYLKHTRDLARNIVRRHNRHVFMSHQTRRH